MAARVRITIADNDFLRIGILLASPRFAKRYIRCIVPAGDSLLQARACESLAAGASEEPLFGLLEALFKVVANAQGAGHDGVQRISGLRFPISIFAVQQIVAWLRSLSVLKNPVERGVDPPVGLVALL
jgi:hypothetical protein